MNIAEFEFPAYCNFFFYRRRVTLIVSSAEVETRIRKVFQETLFGPDKIDLTQDFPHGTDPEDMPDLQKELDYFRVFDGKLMQLEDLLNFVVFDNNGVAKIEKEVDVEKVDETTGEKSKVKEVKQVYLQWRTKGEHDDGEYVILQDGFNCGSVFDTVTLPQPPLPAQISSVFEPPLFGVTVLGNSHGFDPTGRTSGYVLWLSRRGYMVDPPPQSTSILLANNIPPSLITGVIITHCHADHDAGTFQKILNEGRITMMTTKTIHDSFLRKYAALSGLDYQLLSKSFHFRPVKIGEDIKMRGGTFRFFYSLHAIPCVGFEVFLGDKSIVFSADHMNDPPKIKQLHEDGVLTDWRKDQLLNFPWNRDIILHEAGIPPIHTPMATLAALPDDVKKRLYVVHVGSNAFKDEYGLKPAPVGVENTLTLDVQQPENAAALEVLDLVTSIDLFSQLTVQHAREILQIAEQATYKAGDFVIKKGDKGHNMMIIASGKAEVRIKMKGKKDRDTERKSQISANKHKSTEHVPLPGGSLTTFEEGEEEDEVSLASRSTSPRSARSVQNEDEGSRRRSLNGTTGVAADSDANASITLKTFTTGDYFGEQALVAPDCVRSADIVAVTDLVVYQFQRQDFNWLLQGTPVVSKIERMIMARQDACWDLMGMNSVLSLLTPTQKTQLEQRCSAVFYQKGEEVWREGMDATIAVLIDTGVFKFKKSRKSQRRRAPSVFRHLGPPPPPAFTSGFFVGEIDALLENKALQTTLVAAEEGFVMVCTKDDLLEFFTNAPGVLLAMLHTQFVNPNKGEEVEAKIDSVPSAEKEKEERDKMRRSSSTADYEEGNGEDDV